MYKFYHADNKVICVSSYAGKPVRGVAKCDPRDNFDIGKGEALAQARCDAKVAYKRYMRARAKANEAYDAIQKAEAYLDSMSDYLTDADAKLTEAIDHLDALEAEM